MKNTVESQVPVLSPNKLLSVWNRIRRSAVWQSIFRQGYPDTDENRALIVFNTFFLHFHPVKVRKHTLKITYTWGLGIIAIFLFLLLVVTGGILMFWYVPSVEHAYSNIQGLETSVDFGMLLRNLHRWGAHLMVLVIFLHMCRVFFTGGYKRPREFNWVIGVILWVLTLMLSFTGYLLPYDQLAYWAITIASNIAGYAPFIGAQAKFFLLGAYEVGQEAVQRFYGLHIFLLPLVMTALIGVHFWRIRKDGGLSAPREETVPVPAETQPAEIANSEIRPLRPEKTYGLMSLMKRVSPMVERGPENTIFSWPYLLVMEFLAILSTTIFLLVLSFIVNAPLREAANPILTEDPAKAPWFFSAIQELLLHMHPSLAGVLIPVGVILILVVLPYVERRKDDVGIWFASKSGRLICLWSAVYTAIALVGLILFDEFIGVQSIVSGPQLVTGWLVPLGTMGVLMAILYLSLSKWRPNGREIALAFFTAFVTTYIVMTISTQFSRGLGMHLVPFWNLPPNGLTF